jgi:hypothetical protein
MSWAGQASYRAKQGACAACGAMPPWPVVVIKSEAGKGRKGWGMQGKGGVVEYGITVDMQKWHRRRACTGMHVEASA